MRRVMTPREAGEFFEQVARDLEAELARAMVDNLKTANDVARRLSSGGYSAARLAAMGHPYAPGRTPPRDPAVINVQGDVFRAGWETQQPRVSGGTLVGGIYNIDPKAHFLESGTERMVERPLSQRLIRESRNRWDKRVDKGIRKALRG